MAGKTGTAELRDTTNDDPEPTDPEAPPPPPDVTDTDAWFTAFAPARRPRVAVAVMLVGQGAGRRHGRAGGAHGAGDGPRAARRLSAARQTSRSIVPRSPPPSVLMTWNSSGRL